MFDWEDITCKQRIKKDMIVYGIIVSIVLVVFSPLIYILLKSVFILGEEVTFKGVMSAFAVLGIPMLFFVIAILFSVAKNREGDFLNFKIRQKKFEFYDENSLKHSLEFKNANTVFLIKGEYLMFISKKEKENQVFLDWYDGATDSDYFYYPQVGFIAIMNLITNISETAVLNREAKKTKFFTKVRDMKGVEKYLDSLGWRKEKDWKRVRQTYPLIKYKVNKL